MSSAAFLCDGVEYNVLAIMLGWRSLMYTCGGREGRGGGQSSHSWSAVRQQATPATKVNPQKIRMIQTMKSSSLLSRRTHQRQYMLRTDFE